MLNVRATDFGSRSRNGSSGQIPAAVTLPTRCQKNTNPRWEKNSQPIDPTEIRNNAVYGLLQLIIIGHICPEEVVSDCEAQGGHNNITCISGTAVLETCLSEDENGDEARPRRRGLRHCRRPLQRRKRTQDQFHGHHQLWQPFCPQERIVAGLFDEGSRPCFSLQRSAMLR